MSSEAKKYAAYFPVEYDYLKELPTGWGLIPNIAIFDERKERNFSDEELLSISAYKGIVKASEYEDRKDRSSEDKSAYLLVEKGDVAYNTMLAWMGAIGFSKYRGIVSPSYTVLKPKATINPEYFHYQFRASFYRNYIKRYSYGIVDSRLRLYYTYFKRMYSVLPPIDVQNRIVTYLNRIVSDIQSVIQKKERIIGLTNERKGTIITNAVIRGVRTGGRDTTGTWETKRCKYVLNIRNGQVDPKRVKDAILIAPNHLEGGTGRILYKETAYQQNAESGKYEAKKGDVIYSKIRPELNKVCIAEEDCLCSADMYAIYPKRGYDPEFLKYLFLSDRFCKAMVESSMRVAMPKVNREDVKNFKGEFPELSEQRKIVEHINAELKKLDEVIAKTESEIARIKEYEDALITNVVLGKRRAEMEL